MGHLEINTGGHQTSLPINISKFVYSKAHIYTYTSTDDEGLCLRFYNLRPGYSKKWTYYCNGDIINLTYNIPQPPTIQYKTPTKQCSTKKIYAEIPAYKNFIEKPYHVNKPIIYEPYDPKDPFIITDAAMECIEQNIRDNPLR